MIKQFWLDLEDARKVEDLVRETFSNMTNAYTFEDVSKERQYFHKGDIRATAADGRQIYIEVKNDCRIADTVNVLCGEGNFFYESGYVKGNFYSDYEIYCVVSQEERKIYVMDFKVLKAHYKKGEFKAIRHPEQISYCYLLPLYIVKRYNGLIAEVSY